MPRNRFGLSRNIPSPVKREVRQRCGFGCVVCGAGIYDYEHFAPEFQHARFHDPNGITLLCPQCHQRKTRRRLSIDTVESANADPVCLRSGFVSEPFDFAVGHPIEVFLGANVFRGCGSLITLGETPVLSIGPPSEVGAPFTLSTFFSDVAGRVTCVIDQNVWRAATENWDIEWSGPRLIVRRGRRDIVLDLTVEPPGRIRIERFYLQFQGRHLRSNAEMLEFSGDGVSWGQMVCMQFNGVGFHLP